MVCLEYGPRWVTSSPMSSGLLLVQWGTTTVGTGTERYCRLVTGVQTGATRSDPVEQVVLVTVSHDLLHLGANATALVAT